MPPNSRRPAWGIFTNDWDMLRKTNPAKTPKFDAIVANPSFSLRCNPKEELSEDVCCKNHGIAPKSAADFAFLLHGFHYLKDQGVMAIILPQGVLFRGGAEHFEKGKRQIVLNEDHIEKTVTTYRDRREEDRYAKCVSMERIKEEGYNLNISRYISTAEAEEEIDLAATHASLTALDEKVDDAAARHNAFLKEPGLPLLPMSEKRND